MTRKRILNLHWGFSLGGIAKYAEYIDSVSESAPVDMFNLCIARGDKHIDEAALQRLRARIIRIRHLYDISWIWQLKAAIQEVNPDFLMAHAFNGYAVAYVARKLLGKHPPILASFHGGYHPPTLLKHIIAPIYNAFADHVLRKYSQSILTVAHYSADELVQHGVDGNKITVIHNGIPDTSADAGSRERIRTEWGLDDKVQVILAASQLVPYKGVNFLIEGFAGCAEQYPDAVVMILGMGPQEEELKEHVARRGLQQQIRFGGMRSDIVNCLAASDIFVLPSLFEYHSIALLEAMRAGIAIISSDVGGNTESVRHEQEALIVPPSDGTAITRALETLLSDAPLRKKLGENARSRFVDEFTDKHMIETTARWFTKVTA